MARLAAAREARLLAAAEEAAVCAQLAAAFAEAEAVAAAGSGDHARLVITRCEDAVLCARAARTFALDVVTSIEKHCAEVKEAALESMAWHWRHWNLHAMGRQTRRYKRKRLRVGARAAAVAALAAAAADATATGVRHALLLYTAEAACAAAAASAAHAEETCEEAANNAHNAVLLRSVIIRFTSKTKIMGWGFWTAHVQRKLHKRYMVTMTAAATAVSAASIAAALCSSSADVAMMEARDCAMERSAVIACAALAAAAAALAAGHAAAQALSCTLDITEVVRDAARAAAEAAASAASSACGAMDVWFIGREFHLRTVLAAEIAARTASIAAGAAALAAHECGTLADMHEQQYSRALSTLSIDETCALLIDQGFSMCVPNVRRFQYTGDVFGDPIFAAADVRDLAPQIKPLMIRSFLRKFQQLHRRGVRCSVLNRAMKSKHALFERSFRTDMAQNSNADISMGGAIGGGSSCASALLTVQQQEEQEEEGASTPTPAVAFATKSVRDDHDNDEDALRKELKSYNPSLYVPRTLTPSPEQERHATRAMDGMTMMTRRRKSDNDDADHDEQQRTHGSRSHSPRERGEERARARIRACEGDTPLPHPHTTFGTPSPAASASPALGAMEPHSSTTPEHELHLQLRRSLYSGSAGTLLEPREGGKHEQPTSARQEHHRVHVNRHGSIEIDGAPLAQLQLQARAGLAAHGSGSGPPSLHTPSFAATSQAGSTFGSSAAVAVCIIRARCSPCTPLLTIPYSSLFPLSPFLLSPERERRRVEHCIALECKI